LRCSGLGECQLRLGPFRQDEGSGPISLFATTAETWFSSSVAS